MKNNQLKLFFEKNYKRWLQYATYYCQRAGLQGEAYDLLNEVLLMIWQSQDITSLYSMMQKGEKGKTGLDCLIFRVMKTNIFSQNAPYRRQYHHFKYLIFQESFPPDALVLYPEERSTEDLINLITEALEHVDIAPHKIAVFKYYFLEGKKLKEWEGNEALKTLYKMKNEVVCKIKEYIKKQDDSREKKSNLIF